MNELMTDERALSPFTLDKSHLLIGSVANRLIPLRLYQFEIIERSCPNINSQFVGDLNKPKVSENTAL
jgi:hypothetical protein